jgi:two-component system LytT family response regulator
MLNILIVDDEPPARAVIKHYLGYYHDAVIVGEADNGFDALKMVKELQPNLMFMDVQMPKLTGFETLELMENPPEIIFSTAFDNYALKAFEMNAIDYLLKPYDKSRFDAAMQRAMSRILSGNDAVLPPSALLQHSMQSAAEPLTRVAVRQYHQIHVIPIADIDYIESDGDYVLIHTAAGKYLKERTMKYFEQCLPQQQFARIHRSFIVNVDKVSKIELYEKEGYHVHLRTCKDIIKASAAGYRLLKDHLIL